LANLGLQVARALARAHRKGLLHRDLKPANILVTADGEVKVADFGLATLIEPDDITLASVSRHETLTATGANADSPDGLPAGTKRRPVGTLPYMSPEQVAGEDLDARSDIYALGVVLYEMTTGRRPYAGATQQDLVRAICAGRARRPHEIVPKLPLELDRIVVKAMGASRTERYQTMDDLAVDLKRLGRELESGSSPSYEDLKVVKGGGRLRSVAGWLMGAGLSIALVLAWLVGPWRTSAVDPRSVLILPMEM